jgi:tRNA-splicing ligase RtcB
VTGEAASLWPGTGEPEEDQGHEANAPRGGKSMNAANRLIALSIDGGPQGDLRRRLEEVAALPFVESVLALPDVHHKAQMEVPSSIAIRTVGAIVPEFTSVAVNDGMGVVVTDLNVEDATPDRLRDFLRRVNSHAAAHLFDVNRYSLRRDELVDVLVRGGEAVLEKYRHGAEVLQRMEWGGRIPLRGGSLAETLRAVPRQLLHTSFGRAEMGLNFGGNHFLEVQAVDHLLDESLGREWGFRKGQVVVMYHLGPGPFSGTLLHHYSRRTKLRGSRVPLFMVSKLLFHYLQRWNQGRASDKWRLHFRQNGLTPYPVDSEEGATLREALAMATNFGFAYRLATVRAIMDGLEETMPAAAAPRLFCDVAHNGIYEEPWAGRPSWVARHNSCRLAPGEPAIIAGSYDIPSILGIGLDGGNDRLNSYDHGAGSIIEEYRRASQLPATSGTVLRLAMSRGREGQVLKEKVVETRSSEPIDRLMSCLEQHRVVRPVVRLRPVANLKN